jgi:N-acyl-D-amino-acid deacylase
MAQLVSRRGFLKAGGAAAAGVTLASLPQAEAAPAFDLVLRGGTLLDGTGAPAFAADLGIVGDAIAALGSFSAEQGRAVLDVAGLHVAPGFIDVHSHSDGDIVLYSGAESRVLQGVTTELTGNCGSSAAPLAGVDVERRRREWREDAVEADWSDVASYLDRLEKTGIAINQALLLGQGTLRENAVGLVDRPLTDAEMAGVLRAVEEGMEQGAFGLSTGLEYTPGRYTPTDEIVAMARVASRFGGLYASHIRNEEAQLLEAVDEAIEIGRRAGLRVEVSHLKAAGRVNWAKQQGALDLIEAARRQGVDVLADAYPYTAYSTGLTILLPADALEGGDAALIERLKDAATRARLREHLTRQIANEPGDPSAIVIARIKSPDHQDQVGRSLAQIAESWGVEPSEALLRLVEQEQGNVPFIGHAMSPDNVERVLRHPLVMVGSDGSSMAPVGRAAQARPHPRSYGAFARVLGHYGREEKLFELPEAVRKMTSMPADQAGLRDRGRLAPGKKADLVVFEAARVADQATFDDPHRYALGIPHVLVNGTLVVRDGKHTGARPGRALRRT